MLNLAICVIATHKLECKPDSNSTTSASGTHYPSQPAHSELNIQHTMPHMLHYTCNIILICYGLYSNLHGFIWNLFNLSSGE